MFTMLKYNYGYCQPYLIWDNNKPLRAHNEFCIYTNTYKNNLQIYLNTHLNCYKACSKHPHTTLCLAHNKYDNVTIYQAVFLDLTTDPILDRRIEEVGSSLEGKTEIVRVKVGIVGVEIVLGIGVMVGVGVFGIGVGIIGARMGVVRESKVGVDIVIVRVGVVGSRTGKSSWPAIVDFFSQIEINLNIMKFFIKKISTWDKISLTCLLILRR